MKRPGGWSPEVFRLLGVPRHLYTCCPACGRFFNHRNYYRHRRPCLRKILDKKPKKVIRFDETHGL